MGGEMFILDEVDFDAGMPTVDAQHSVVRLDCGMTILSEAFLDAGAGDDLVERQVESLAQLIAASANPDETAARVRQLLRDRIDNPTPPSTGRP